MKHCISFRTLLIAVAASALFIQAQPAFAQADGQPRRGGGGFGAFQNMTEEQRDAIRQMNQETREQLQNAAQARGELNDAIFAQTVNEGDIKAKAAALAKAEEELAIARAKAFAKVRAKFSNEQIEMLKNLPVGRGGGPGRGPGARRGNL